MSNNGYMIITKDQFIERKVCKERAHNISSKRIDYFYEEWDRIRGDYAFVILAGDVMYSVDYFNNNILKCEGKDRLLELFNNKEKRKKKGRV